MWLNSHDPKWLNFKRPLTSDDDQARADAIRVYLAVIFNSHLELDSIMEAPNLAEVLSLNGE